MTESGQPLAIQPEVGPDLRPVPTIPVIYVAPVSRVCSGAQQGMKVLTVSVGEGGRWWGGEGGRGGEWEFSQLSAQL